MNSVHMRLRDLFRTIRKIKFTLLNISLLPYVRYGCLCLHWGELLVLWPHEYKQKRGIAVIQAQPLDLDLTLELTANLYPLNFTLLENQTHRPNQTFETRNF